MKSSTAIDPSSWLQDHGMAEEPGPATVMAPVRRQRVLSQRKVDSGAYVVIQDGPRMPSMNERLRNTIYKGSVSQGSVSG